MRLTYVFTSFLLGLLVTTPLRHGEFEFLSVAGFAACLGALLFFSSNSRFNILTACFAFFFFGAIWMSWLPALPEPLTADTCVELTGTAVSEAFEAPEGRYFPVKIKNYHCQSIESVPADSATDHVTETGIVLVKVDRDFSGTSGALYVISGITRTDREILMSPVKLRYRPRAIIILYPDTDPVLIGNPGMFDSLINRLKYRLTNHLSWALSESEGQLVSGITFGRKGRKLDGSVAGEFYTSGLSHLIVASGAQVSLVFTPLFFLLSRIRPHRFLKWLLLLAVGLSLICFTRLLGGEPSILRASTMGCILLFSLALQRSGYGLSTLSAAGFYWLIQNPLLTRDAGFLLSMSASYGIIYISPVLFLMFPAFNSRLKKVSKYKIKSLPEYLSLMSAEMFRFFKSSLIVTFSAQVAVLPVIASCIGRLSIAGFFSNLLAVPLGTIILILGVLSSISGFICPRMSVIINPFAGLLANALMGIAHFFSAIPFANSPISPLPAPVIFVYIAGIILFVEKSRSLKNNDHHIEGSEESLPQPAQAIDLDQPLPRW